MIQLAILGVWHVHASDYTKQTQEADGADIKKVWDKDPSRAEKFAGEFGLEVVTDLDQLLSDETIDGVIICTETADHDEVIAKAARAGKAVFTEKTLALGAAAAEELSATIRDAGVPFVISYPQLTHPATLKAKAAIKSGALGDIVKMRFRNAHGGKAQGWLPAYWYDTKTAGGGALMDLGCHPVYLANALMGRADAVMCTLSPETQTPEHADDEATVVLSYGSDGHAQAILETSFLTPYSPRLFELYGTKGTLIASDNDIKLLGVEGDIECDSEIKMPLPTFIDMVTASKEDASAPRECEHYGLDAAIGLAEVLEAAYISAAEGRSVKL